MYVNIINLFYSGRVVNMSSMNGRHPWPSTSAYNASKYGVECVSDCLRLEMLKFGVKVSLIEPAMFGGSTSIHSPENVRFLAYFRNSDGVLLKCNVLTAVLALLQECSTLYFLCSYLR